MDLKFIFLLSLSVVMKSVLASSQAVPCPDAYKRFSFEHSACKAPSATCDIKKSTISQNEQLVILDLHNSFRSVIASAQKTDSGLPSASNMLQMEWDDELASVAQNYAKQCIFGHDCPNCRQVVNFGVGQNIAMQTLTGNNLPPPSPDWSFAVREWFEEIVYFNKELVNSFQIPTGGEFRHFSQLIWADTFRVGCGYVLHKDGNTWTSLYICNYGPAGNVYNTAVYKEGPICTQCPINTCCGASCIEGLSKYPGLCKRINNEPPKVAFRSTKTAVLFECNFQDANKKDCSLKVDGDGSYKVINALGGYYLETILPPGKSSTLIFTKPIKPISKTFCVILHYRKGPTRSGNQETNAASEIFVIPDMNSYTYSQQLPSYPDPARLSFSTFSLSLEWDAETHMKINFAVPANGNEQFLNIKSISAVDGSC